MIGALLPHMSESTWPAGGVERVPNCPICGATERRLVYDGLSDRLFFVAPGTWSFWQCGHCRTAWLDPRPTAATIHIAYRDYYTHNEAEAEKPRTAFQRVRAALGNGYRNRRYGTRLSPALTLGSVMAALVPPLRWAVDAQYRYLPRVAPGSTPSVLDIGCGSGAWLEIARSAGWQVAGVEPDPVSRGRARDRAIDVRETIRDWLDGPSFGYVTINHVIEHVHDPLGVLRDSYALLRPGGGLYVDTPNIDAWGHALYGRDWLHLDPPRHLMLFNRKSLTDSIVRVGFRQIEYRRQSSPFRIASVLSRQIRAGLDPLSDETSHAMDPPPSIIMQLRSSLARRRAEFLTVTAVRPQ